MANYKARGIILKRTNFGEADRLLTIFTLKYGKIRAIAKGVRKQNSRLGGNLEPFCLIDLMLAKGRNLDIVTEAEIINSFAHLRNDLKKTHATYYFAEVIDKMTIDNVEHDDIFKLLSEVTRELKDNSGRLLFSYFELNVAQAVGYKPELQRCLKCHQGLIQEGNFFDLNEGGLVCGSCHQSKQTITPESIKVLRLLAQGKIDVLSRLNVGSEIVNETALVTSNFLEHLNQGDFTARRFIY